MFIIHKGIILPNLYNLLCSCGLFIPIATNQAGCQIACSCGQQLQVPSLSGILELEPVTEHEAQKNETIKPPKSKPRRSIHAKQVVLVTGVVGLIVASLLFVFMALLSVSLSFRSPFIYARSGYPQLHDVCLMQQLYVHDGKRIGRDTQPISPRDFRLLVDDRIIPPYYVIWSEDVINNHPFLASHPIFLVEMHDNLKGGLELSYNFNEKYEKLVFYYWARIVVFSVLMVVSLVVLIVGIFLPKHVEDIGERGGESWE